MTLKNIKKASQLFLVKIKFKDELSEVLLLIKNYSIGGVIINKDVYNTYDELKEIIDSIHKANRKNKIPIWIGIEELPLEFHKLPTSYKLGKKDHAIIKKASYALNELKHNLGINIDINTSMDLRNNDNNNCFNSNPRRICEIYDDLIPGHKKYKVMPIIKHFPGQGRLKESRLFLPVITDYPNKDLVPFEHAINKGIDSILLGNVIVRGKSGISPISLSNNFIKNEIRKEYKYKGLIISKRNNLIIRAIKAGNDIIYVSYNKHIKNSIERIANLLDKGLINIDDSYNRIINTKEKYKLEDISYFDNINIDKYNRQIDKINE